MLSENEVSMLIRSGSLIGYIYITVLRKYFEIRDLLPKEISEIFLSRHLYMFSKLKLSAIEYDNELQQIFQEIEDIILRIFRGEERYKEICTLCDRLRDCSVPEIDDFIEDVNFMVRG